MANTFLLTWNPAKYSWPAKYLDAIIKHTRAGRSPSDRWSCSNSKKPATGDRVFITKLGKQGRGIFGSGWITRGSHERPEEAEFGPRGIELEWDAFLDPRLPSSLLDPTRIEGHWTPENSGISISKTAAAKLELLWLKHLDNHEQSPCPRNISDNEVVSSFELEALEGEIVEKLVKHRKRERSLRDAKLARYRADHGSLACEVCNFDFMATFGVVFAEVHHVKPLRRSDGKPTSLSDLAVLCANCHRAAHHNRLKSLSLVELRTMRRS